MPAHVLRRSLWTLAVGALVLVAIGLLLPFAASTRLVRDRIAQEMTAWSGYRVSIGAPPEIQIWPRFRAVLTDLSLTPWDAPDDPPILSAERAEIDLSALSVLRGHIAFTQTTLVRPTLRLQHPENGRYALEAPDGGRFATSVALARDIVEADPKSPDATQLPDHKFGIVEFHDGRIVVGGAGAEAEVASHVSGSVNWSALDNPATLTASAIWNGENVGITVAATKPLLLLGGGTSPISIAARTAPASLSFDGSASFADHPVFEGEVQFSTPSAGRLLDWLGAGAMSSAAIQSIAMESHVSADRQHLRLENVQMALDSNPGRGAIELSMDRPLPFVSATMAFESLDLRSFLATFTPLDLSPGAPTLFDAGIADRMGIDLRLSAGRATIGTIALSNVAATARIDEDFAAFDISDAQAFAGTVQASMRVEGQPDRRAELRLRGSAIEGAALGSALGMTRLAPSGTGSLALAMKGPVGAWDAFMDKAKGSLTAEFGAGALSGIDFVRFMERTAGGRFFALDDVAGGKLPVDSVELKASIEAGVATIDKAVAKSGNSSIVLSGLVPYVGRGLALSGQVERQDGGVVPTGATATFFVGGSWNAPFIAPVPKPVVDE